ncbi:MAG: tRNA (adenosine(37)-N6)-threonylcarbamoyltransferase complex dimerization subunit type 1 TsaB [Verrucomicrobiota bacterium]
MPTDPEQYIVALETSTPFASVALKPATGEISRRSFHSDRNHNSLLFAPLAELLHGISPEEIGLVLVGSGPGSYSGTRAGIAAAQGIALAAGCPCIALPSILAVPQADAGIPFRAIGDARRGTFWFAEMMGSQLTKEPLLCDATQLTAELEAAAAAKIPVISFEEPRRFPVDPILAESIRVEFPDAARLLRAWQTSSGECRSRWLSAIPQPIYLKPPHVTPGKRASFFTP